jgi:hypothetical protein
VGRLKKKERGLEVVEVWSEGFCCLKESRDVRDGVPVVVVDRVVELLIANVYW